MALKKEMVLDTGMVIEYIKIRDCQVIVDTYKDEEARRAGLNPAKQERVSLNDIIITVEDGQEFSVSKLAEELAEALYIKLKATRFPDAEDC